MKKALMTIALAAFAFAANAQFVIGGKLDVNHDNKHTEKYTYGDVSTNISILPKFGYWLNDKMQVGAQLGWSMGYERSYRGSSQDDYSSESISSIFFAPYFRYNLASWKNFTVFCEAKASLSFGLDGTAYSTIAGVETTTEIEHSYTGLGLTVVPGFNYALSEHFSLDLYLNLVGLYVNTTSTDGYASHSWGLMANMNAQSINSHLSNFAIGFNYAF